MDGRKRKNDSEKRRQKMDLSKGKNNTGNRRQGELTKERGGTTVKIKD
jgi:hypothetical protein